jgi:hypothetical protein
MPRLNRRTFMQGTGLALASSLIERLSFADYVFAQSCNPAILVSRTVPNSLSRQPQLMALRAETLLQQIQRNCGYFGQPRNWTSLWSYSQLSLQTQGVLSDMVQTFNALSAVQAITAADLQQEATYDNAAQTMSTFIDQLRDDIDSNQAKLQPLLPQIAVLKDQITAQKQIVDARQAAFNAAVLAAAGTGCSFLEVIDIVAAVIAVVAAVFTLGSSLVAAYAALGDLAATGITAVATLEGGVDLFNTLKDDYTKISTVVKKTETAISTAVNAANELKAKYQKLQAELGADASPDSGKVIVDDAKFDSLSEDRFQAFKASVNSATAVSADIRNQLLDAVHKWFDLTTLRNKKIYEYDSSVLAIQNDARQYYEACLERAAVQTAKADLQNNSLDLVSFQETIQRVQAAQLQVMRRAVWEEKRAFAFSRRDPSLISDAAMADIQLQGCSPVWLLSTHSTIARETLHKFCDLAVIA